MNHNYYANMGILDPNALPQVNTMNAAGWTMMTVSVGAILGFIFLDNFEKVAATKERWDILESATVKLNLQLENEGWIWRQ
jgi:hypothetical protein